MNIIILGPQGSGKGTQAKLLAEELGLVYVEIGGLLRSEIAKETLLGQEIAGYINKGNLVPDKIAFTVVGSFLSKANLQKGILFDGFPRTMSQAQILEKKLQEQEGVIDAVILLNISRQESIKRLSARRFCPQCKRIYNLLTLPPKNPELCDSDGSRLLTREDELPEAIDKRLDLYRQETKPVIAYFRQKGLVIDVDGERPVEVIFAEILEKLHIQ